MATRVTRAASRILIADDSEIIRASVRALLEAQDGWSICGEAGDGQEAMAMAEELRPDLIILDLAMPVMTGLQAAAAILKKEPDVPIILYTMHESKEIDLEAKKAGARMVIAKSDSTEILLQGIQELLAQRSAAPMVAAALTEGPAQTKAQVSVEQLSEGTGNPKPAGEEPTKAN